MTPQLNAWIYTIGWALIHFVWQGGLIALATAAVLASCRHRSSQTRYAIACAGLVAMLAAPAITAAVVVDDRTRRSRLEEAPRQRCRRPRVRRRRP